MAEVKTVAAGVSQKAVSLPVREYIEPQAMEDSGVAKIIREDNPPTVTSVRAVPESQESMSGYDPLDAVISALSAKYPANYRKEEVLAACLLISDGVLRNGRLDLTSVDESVREWLERLGVFDSKIGLPKPTFEKMARRLAGLQLSYQLEDIVKLTCPRCFTYPITPSHVCPSNGGGRHE